MSSPFIFGAGGTAKSLVSGGTTMPGSTSGNLTTKAAAATTDYTITWPAAVAVTAGSIPTSGTDGTLSWTASLPIANGGTGATTKAAAFDALQPMTTLGDVVYGGASGTGTRLAGDTSNTRKFLRTQSSSGTAAAPAWDTIQAGDVPTLNQNTTGTASNVTGTVAIANGGTGQTSKAAGFDALQPMTTLGDTIYGGTSGTGTRLAGDTSNTRKFLRTQSSAGTAAAPAWDTIATGDLSANIPLSTIGITLTGNGSVITTGVQSPIYIPFACTINSVTLMGDVSGSIVIDIWKVAYASFPPTVANTITASALPTLSSQRNSQDTTLTGWTTSIAAGDTLLFNVNSASTVTKVTLVLKVTKT